MQGTVAEIDISELYEFGLASEIGKLHGVSPSSHAASSKHGFSYVMSDNLMPGFTKVQIVLKNGQRL